MNARTEERVDGWTSRRFTGGYDGLQQLADEEFSGIVETDGGPWACLLNGKVIGVFDGRIEDFEDAGGTTYVAPDPAVPLLFAMHERGGTLEEQYYTKDAPISEADRTLSSGSFVGYIELSENVLSGDYYVCYYGGRSMPVAFVGNSDQLVTGDEAFERANDEVGIYDVYSVDMEVVEIPGSEATADAAAVGTTDGGPGTAGDDPSGQPAETNGAGGSEAGYGSGADGTDLESGIDDADYGTDSADTGYEAEVDDADYETGTDDPGYGTDDDEYGTEVDDADYGTDSGDTEYGSSGESIDYGSRTGGSGDDADSRPPDDADSGPGRDSTSTGTGGDPYGDELDGGSAEGDEISYDESGMGADDGGIGTGRSGDRARGDGRADPSRTGSVDRAALETVRERVRHHEKTIETLKDQLSVAKREHDQFEDEHERLADDTERLHESVGQLESDLQESVGQLESDLQDLYRRVDRMEDRLGAIDRIEERLDDLASRDDPVPEESDPAGVDDGGADGGAASAETPEPESSEPVSPGGVDLSPGEALRETNLLVRYDSKGKPTLGSIHGSDADEAAINDNLRLDTHTSFEESEATVEGRPFREFLHDRLEYEFAEWLVRDLPYEIRDTGNTDALGDLYDALPEIDRIEMYADIEIIDEEDGTSETVIFDVVVRDKSGRPLVVANFNDSRDPATKEMVVDLEESARTLRAASDLRSALLVTKSYFAPEALETVEEVTGGSLLSRDSKKSYVKLSRKRGYHLCLVESRDGDFHVNVPEL